MSLINERGTSLRWNLIQTDFVLKLLSYDVFWVAAKLQIVAGIGFVAEPDVQEAGAVVESRRV